MTYTRPIAKPVKQAAAVTFALLHFGFWSQITVMMLLVRAEAEPRPRVNSIRKNSTANTFRVNSIRKNSTANTCVWNG